MPCPQLGRSRGGGTARRRGDRHAYVPCVGQCLTSSDTAASGSIVPVSSGESEPGVARRELARLMCRFVDDMHDDRIDRILRRGSGNARANPGRSLALEVCAKFRSLFESGGSKCTLEVCAKFAKLGVGVYAKMRSLLERSLRSLIEVCLSDGEPPDRRRGAGQTARPNSHLGAEQWRHLEDARAPWTDRSLEAV